MLSPGYKRYALGLMTLVYTVNLFDRGLMLILLQPIKQDLRLSDTQLGLATGIAFAVFYGTIGIPIARWADRGNRSTIAALALGLWGLTSMAFSLVGNFVQLILARIAAGVGDAGAQPPLYSLIADYFPEKSERTRAMYIWAQAPCLAALCSLGAAGWLNEQVGWRMTFVLMGLVGLLFAVLIKATLREPRLTGTAVAVSKADAPSFLTTLRFMWREPVCRQLTIAITLMYLVGYGAVTWQASLMIRRFGIGTAELGFWMGLITGLGGVVSLLLGNFVINRWFAVNQGGQMRLASLAIAVTAPVFVWFLFAPALSWALAALLLQTLVNTAFFAPVYVVLQDRVPETMRATALTVILLLANLLGMGLGPLLVGALSDTFAMFEKRDPLASAMLILSVCWPWAAVHLWLVGRELDSLANDHRAVDAEPGQSVGLSGCMPDRQPT